MGCTVENVEPKFYGVIEGVVLSSKTQEGIANVSITTNPGTEAVLTNAAGEFTLSHVPVGDYLVQATKEGYQTESVRVTVNRADTTTVKILLEVDKESPPAGAFLTAEVTSFFNNTTDGDTTYVEVNYTIRNTSDNEAIPNYEIYFKIYTPHEDFLYEVSGDSLHAGQKDMGFFEEYIRDYTADSVVVTDIYAPT